MAPRLFLSNFPHAPVASPWERGPTRGLPAEKARRASARARMDDRWFVYASRDRRRGRARRDDPHGGRSWDRVSPGRRRQKKKGCRSRWAPDASVPDEGSARFTEITVGKKRSRGGEFQEPWRRTRLRTGFPWRRAAHKSGQSVMRRPDQRPDFSSNFDEVKNNNERAIFRHGGCRAIKLEL